MRKNNSQLHGQAQTRPAKNRDAQEHPAQDQDYVLTQEELVRWWPFKRLAPHRFPQTPQHVYPDAPI